MKKIAYIIIAAFAVITVACTGNSQQENEKMQKRIDSTVQSFVDSKKDELKKMCDDQLMAAAQDSAKVMMESSKKSTHTAAHHTTTKPVVKTVPPVVKPTIAPNTNTGKKTDAAVGTNSGKKTEASQAAGVNMGKKK
jgi:hypothetical protein